LDTPKSFYDDAIFFSERFSKQYNNFKYLGYRNPTPLNSGTQAPKFHPPAVGEPPIR
jgi:hypothetical protein